VGVLLAQGHGMRRVHIRNAVQVYSLRVSLFRRAVVSPADACACCGELAPRSSLVDWDGDRVHATCAQVS
jgi:formylmethanofuran dehydrogenase subunit E